MVSFRKKLTWIYSLLRTFKIIIVFSYPWGTQQQTPTLWCWWWPVPSLVGSPSLPCPRSDNYCNQIYILGSIPWHFGFSALKVHLLTINMLRGAIGAPLSYHSHFWHYHFEILWLLMKRNVKIFLLTFFFLMHRVWYRAETSPVSEKNLNSPKLFLWLKLQI